MSPLFALPFNPGARIKDDELKKRYCACLNSFALPFSLLSVFTLDRLKARTLERNALVSGCQHGTIGIKFTTFHTLTQRGALKVAKLCMHKLLRLTEDCRLASCETS